MSHPSIAAIRSLQFSTKMLLKCNSCNLVICELLAYIQNKLSIADEDSLVRICASNFSISQIEEANNLLADSLPANLRRPVRKGKDKENRMLHDIISLFKSVDPEILPVFVARDLEKLPPITFDHLDVSKFLKDLAVIQADIKTIKESYVTTEQLQDIRKECLNFKSTSPPFSAVKVNMKRGAYRDSGPAGLSYLDQTFISNQGDQSNHEASKDSDLNMNYSCSNINKSREEGSQRIIHEEMIHQPVGPPAASAERATTGTSSDGERQVGIADPSSSDDTSVRTNAPAPNQTSASFAEVAKTGGEWITVQRRKAKPSSYRYLGRAGVSNDKSSNFRAAIKYVPLFLTKVHKDTTEKDIAEYIFDKMKETIVPEKLSIQKEKDYNAYKFSVPESKLSMYLNENLWPEGVIFRRFINFRQKASNGVSKTTMNDPAIPCK